MSTFNPSPLPQFSGTAVKNTALFSPAFLAAATIWPLRYFFSMYGAPVNLQWTSDPTTSQILIDTANNFHLVPIGTQPRVLVDRGGYQVNPTGLTDDLAEALPVDQTKGLTNRTNFTLYAGTTTVTIQTRQEGSCERVTDMVQHFLLWTKEYLCASQGFKTYAKGMTATTCTPVQDTTTDIEIFQVSLQVPWVMEEMWAIKNDAVTIKGIDQIFTYTA